MVLLGGESRDFDYGSSSACVIWLRRIGAQNVVLDTIAPQNLSCCSYFMKIAITRNF